MGRCSSSNKNACFVISVNLALFAVLLLTSRECWPCILKFSLPRFVILVFGLTYSGFGIMRKVILLTISCQNDTLHAKECQLFFLIDVIIIHLYTITITVVENYCPNTVVDRADPTCKTYKFFAQVLKMILWLGWFFICFGFCIAFWLCIFNFEAGMKQKPIRLFKKAVSDSLAKRTIKYV